MFLKFRSGLSVIVLLGMMVLTNHARSQVWNPTHAIGTINGVYNYSYNQTPAQLVELFGAAVPNTGLAYQWESNLTPVFPAVGTIVGSSISYTFSGPLSQTTYYRRKSTYTANGS